jgi:hypothetical protein
VFPVQTYTHQQAVPGGWSDIVVHWLS